MLSGYEDEELCDFLEFGFPIGYLGKCQQQNAKSVTFVRNHSGAKDFPSDIQKYLEKELSQLTHLRFKNVFKTLLRTLGNVFMERLYNVKMANFFYVIRTFSKTLQKRN